MLKDSGKNEHQRSQELLRGAVFRIQMTFGGDFQPNFPRFGPNVLTSVRFCTLRTRHVFVEK